MRIEFRIDYSWRVEPGDCDDPHHVYMRRRRVRGVGVGARRSNMEPYPGRDRRGVPLRTPIQLPHGAQELETGQAGYQS